MTCLATLEVDEVVAVGMRSRHVSQLQSAGIHVTSIADDLAVIPWLEDNGHPVDYYRRR